MADVSHIYKISKFSVIGYATVSLSKSILIIGGTAEYSFDSQVSKFSNNDWSKIGSLLYGRIDHTVINLNGQILIFGGSVTANAWWKADRM